MEKLAKTYFERCATMSPGTPVKIFKHLKEGYSQVFFLHVNHLDLLQLVVDQEGVCRGLATWAGQWAVPYRSADTLAGTL